MPLPFSGRPRESPPRPNLSQPPLHPHRQPPSPTPQVPLHLSRRPSSISTVSPPRLHHESPSSLPQAFLHLHRQPPRLHHESPSSLPQVFLHLHRQPPSPTPRVPLFSPADLPPSPSSAPSVFCLEGVPALGGIPLRRSLHPSIPPVSPSAQHPLYQSSREDENALT